ncbi:hypothetical protein ACFXG4_30495 [Nocardia sp. NPDC059246]|uniref:hypothetical protein n=1 Tax=unclassified Nocardia TaxID=2637762 RepID=UPI0036813E06
MTATPKIEMTVGIALSSWRYTAPDRTRYLFSVAHVVGCLLTPGADLRFTPVPSIEVRTADPDIPDFTTREYLPIPDATKTRIPWDQVTETVTQYCTAVETAFTALKAARGDYPEPGPLIVDRFSQTPGDPTYYYDKSERLSYAVARIRLGNVNTLIHREGCSRIAEATEFYTTPARRFGFTEFAPVTDTLAAILRPGRKTVACRCWPTAPF